MKKYSVFVKFKNGKSVQFETDTDIKKVAPTIINEQPMLITEESNAINLRHVKEIIQEINGHLH